MGLEAVCRCQVGALSADAKVLLEAHELILRNPFRRTIPIADMRAVEVVSDQLRFQTGDTVVILELGASIAAKWAKRVATPPPTLARKLGIGHASPAYVIGEIEDQALLEALDGHTGAPELAKLSLAIVRDEQELLSTLVCHEAAMGNAAIWVVHGKGTASTFGEAPVRQRMRARGYRDTKVSAVSAALSATRYSLG